LESVYPACEENSACKQAKKRVSWQLCQLLAHGRWFSLGTPASSTTKTGRHDIAEILLKVALSTNKSINRPTD
jgi:hypothetical protein